MPRLSHQAGLCEVADRESLGFLTRPKPWIAGYHWRKIRRAFSFCRARHSVDTAFQADTFGAEKSGDPPPLTPSFKIKGDFHYQHSGFVVAPGPQGLKARAALKVQRRSGSGGADQGGSKGAIHHLADLCSVLRRDTAPSGLNICVCRALAPRPRLGGRRAVPGNIEPDQSAGSTTDKSACLTGAGGGCRNREISPAEPCQRIVSF